MVTLAEFLLDRIAEDEARGGHDRDVPHGETDCLCGERGYIAERNFGPRGSELKITHYVGYTPPVFQDGYLLTEPAARTHTHVLVGEEVREVMGKWPLSASSRRVLAECEAKRRIVEMHSDGRAELRYPGDGLDDEDDYLPAWCVRCTVEHEGEPWPCETLRLLARPYSSHEDYRDEWKP